MITDPNQKSDLRQNCFFILGVEVRDTKEIISEKLEEKLSANSEREEVFLRAQRDLNASKSRLKQESTWLLDVPTSLAQEISVAIEKGILTSQDSLHFLSEIGPISAANLSAHCLQTGLGSNGIFITLVSSWTEINTEYLIESVNSNRKVSGFPLVDSNLVEEAVVELQDNHSRVAFDWLVANGDTQQSFTDLFKNHSSTLAKDFVGAIVRKYDSSITPKLKDLDEKIASTEKALREAKAPERKAIVSTLNSHLQEWSKLNFPSHTIHQNKGLEDPRAKELLERIRSLVLWLANEKEEHELSLELSKKLLEFFPSETSSALLVRDDIATLNDLVKSSKTNKEVGPLLETFKRTLDEGKEFIGSVERGHFRRDGIGLAGDLYKKFLETISSTISSTSLKEAWDLIAVVPRYCADNMSSKKAAIYVIEALTALNAPEEIRKELERTRKIYKYWLTGTDFAASIRVKEFEQASRYANDLKDFTNREAESKKWKTISQELSDSKNAKVYSIALFLAGIFLVAVYAKLVIGSKQHKPISAARNETSSYRPAEPMVNNSLPTSYQRVAPVVAAYPTTTSYTNPTMYPTTAPTAAPEVEEPWKSRRPLIYRMLGNTTDEDMAEISRGFNQLPKVERGDVQKSRQWNEAGLGQLKLDATDIAAQSFARAATLDIGNVEAWNNFGYALIKLKDYKTAVTAIIASLSLAPTRADAWANLAECFAALEEPGGAFNAHLRMFTFTKDTFRSLLYLKRQSKDSNPLIAKASEQAFAAGMLIYTAPDGQKIDGVHTREVLPGVFSGISDDSKEAHVRLVVSGTYAKLSVSSSKCNGIVEGTIQAEKGLLKFQPQNTSLNCNLSFVPSGADKVLVIEDECSVHESQCSFTGIYRRST